MVGSVLTPFLFISEIMFLKHGFTAAHTHSVSVVFYKKKELELNTKGHPKDPLRQGATRKLP